ncbi:MAG: tRNA (adenosine(37)-N6)-threonylcarbamoyltransferase complex dimerization subunit type 1 TsaB [Ichthyobacteriaceae bacterium]|nr:tRNA (adenosine(37)-N6)-threonylcarbamoyltransferase complex dimerization subunit type 1 TsaB [Ichthyobacteriaceae bacterium]
MALILNLETATKNCSVSISENGKIISVKELNSSGFSHAEKLHPFIQDVLNKAELKLTDIDAVAISKGPGSYTGLRIGVSSAKGICYGNNIPLIAISTLDSMAYGQKNINSVLVPMLDARRMEVYAKVLNNDLEEIRKTEAEIIDENSYSEFLEKGEVTFFGDGAEKCKDIITSSNAKFVDNIFPSAIDMAQLSENKFIAKDFENTAYFEPFYLKDFVATKSLKK